jgi:hypothetical protein
MPSVAVLSVSEPSVSVPFMAGPFVLVSSVAVPFVAGLYGHRTPACLVSRGSGEELSGFRAVWQLDPHLSCLK